MFPISLPLLLQRSQSRNLSGLPPSYLRTVGTICFSPSDMLNGNYNLMSPILISHEDHSTIAYAWPLDLVADGYVALDDICLGTLEIPSSKCIPPQNYEKTTPKRGKGKKSKGKKDSKSPANYKSPQARKSDFESPFTTPLKNELIYQTTPVSQTKERIMLTLTSLNSTILPASRLELEAPAAIEACSSEEYSTMLKAQINGRLFVHGMRILTTIFGAEIAMRISRLDHSRDVMIDQIQQTYRITEDTRIVLRRNHEDRSMRDEFRAPLHENIRGLDSQVNQLKALAVQAFESCKEATRSNEELDFIRANENTHVPSGVLLKGAPGTGKTLAAYVLASALAVHLETVSGAELAGRSVEKGTQEIRNVFRRAKRLRPSIVLLDELESVTPRRGISNDSKLTGVLLALLDGMGSKREGVFVVATTNKPDDIDSAMRRAGRLDYEIEIPVPSMSTRVEILQGLVTRAKDKLQVDESAIIRAGEIAHGFVAADLVSAWRLAIGHTVNRCGSKVGLIVREDDLLTGIRCVRPSSLREAQVEVPCVHWTDIGGQDNVKQRLQEAVEWPLTSTGKTIFKQMGISAPRGLLLYGPPGCSKTLLARAVATECGANFIAVKGAEVLSKWVGESEKTVRRIFERARAAAPCVVFLDEVDALVPKRGGNGGAGSGAHARVVAQILAEMDGIKDNGYGVVVIAATNRPDRIDPAFMRRGRMDVKVYIGLPSENERKEILRVHSKGLHIDEEVLDNVVNWTDGFSGAEVAAVVREAKLATVERVVVSGFNDSKETDVQILKEDWETAKTRVSARTPAEVLEYFDKYRQEVGDDSIMGSSDL